MIKEFKCKSCGITFDVDDRFDKEYCVECSSIELERIYNSPGISFKGSGFYVNDYRSK